MNRPGSYTPWRTLVALYILICIGWAIASGIAEAMH